MGVFINMQIAASSGDMRRALEACSVALANLTAENSNRATEEAAIGEFSLLASTCKIVTLG